MAKRRGSEFEVSHAPEPSAFDVERRKLARGSRSLIDREARSVIVRILSVGGQQRPKAAVVGKWSRDHEYRDVGQRQTQIFGRQKRRAAVKADESYFVVNPMHRPRLGRFLHEVPTVPRCIVPQIDCAAVLQLGLSGHFSSRVFHRCVVPGDQPVDDFQVLIGPRFGLGRPCGTRGKNHGHEEPSRANNFPGFTSLAVSWHRPRFEVKDALARTYQHRVQPYIARPGQSSTGCIDTSTDRLVGMSPWRVL